MSFQTPLYSADIDALGTLRLLEAIRELPHPGPLLPGVLVGDVRQGGRGAADRDDAVPPAQPVCVAKVYSYWQTVNYREAYGLHASNGILFNHESPRRGETFVTRKITRAATRIKLGLQEHLYLGNLDAERDWGFAGDYVEAMWLMLQQDEPDDYVIATGERHSVREFCEAVFGCSISTGASTSGSISAICAPPRSTCCKAMRPRRARCWVGSRRRRSRSWSG